MRWIIVIVSWGVVAIMLAGCTSSLGVNLGLLSTATAPDGPRCWVDHGDGNKVVCEPNCGHWYAWKACGPGETPPS